MDGCVVRLHTVKFKPKIDGSRGDFTAQPIKVHFYELLGISDANELVPQVLATPATPLHPFSFLSRHTSSLTLNNLCASVHPLPTIAPLFRWKQHKCHHTHRLYDEFLSQAIRLIIECSPNAFTLLGPLKIHDGNAWLCQRG